MRYINLLFLACFLILQSIQQAYGTVDNYMLSGNSISYKEKKAVSEEINQVAKASIRDFLKDLSLNPDQHLEISTNINFDDEALKKDSEEDRQRQIKDFDAYREQAYTEYLKRLQEAKKNLSEDQKQKDEKMAENTESFIAGDKKTRFGSLNIDIDAALANQILSQDLSSQNASSDEKNLSGDRSSTSMMFSVALPSIERPELKLFNFNPLHYVKSIEHIIYLESALKDQDKTNLEKIIKDKINMFIGKEIGDQKLSFKTFKPYQKSWTERFLAPESGTISQILSSLLLSICVLMGLLVISKVFKLIAKNMLELKPIEEKNANATIDALWQESHEMEDDKEDSQGNIYDASATANALTSEMKTIRSQLEEAIKEMPQIAAEILHDLFYDQEHLSRFRELLSFAGYQPLKPAIDLLPQKLLDILKEYVEEVRGTPANLLIGVQVAQTLYQDITSRIYTNNSQNGNYKLLRECLLKIEDKIIGAAAKNLTFEEIALLLNTLTSERADRLSSLLSADILKEALIKLDQGVANENETLINLLDKLETFARENAEQSSGVASRFIMRLVNNASIDDEEKIWAMIPPNDWDIKIKIMRSKFFFKDIKYVDMKYLKLVLDVLAPRHKANLLLLFPRDIKEHYLAQIKDGSKLKEMLLTEIEQIANNDAEMTDIIKKRQKIIQGFLDNLRPMVARNDDIIKEVILKQCEESNLDIPDFVKTPIAEAQKSSNPSETDAAA